MSQSERGPRVVSPLSSRNGNPTGPEAIRCVLLMPVLPHCKCWTACCSVLTIQVAENRPCSRLRFQLGIWLVPTSFCVEHHRHFLSRPFDRESRLFHSSYLTNSSCSILKWGTQMGHNSCAPLTMWTGGVVRRKAGTSRHSVQNNRPAFSSQLLLRCHQPVWWPGFEARFHNKALHGRSCIHMGGVKQRLNPSPRKLHLSSGLFAQLLPDRVCVTRVTDHTHSSLSTLISGQAVVMAVPGAKPRTLFPYCWLTGPPRQREVLQNVIGIGMRREAPYSAARGLSR